MALGMFLILGAVTIYSQGTYSFQITEGTSRVQENMRFAFDTLEPDMRLAGFWGMHNGNADINTDSAPAITCGGADVSNWVFDTPVGITARNNITNNDKANVAANSRVAADCAAFDQGIAQNTDILEVRRSSANVTDLAAGTVQVKSNRERSQIFSDGNEPADFANQVDIDGTFDYVFNTYYVARTSSNIADTPSLRRRTLVGTEVVDEEVIAGVEDMQIQFGVDANNDGSVDRYIDPDAAGFTADSNVIAVRIWLLMRSEYEEVGQQDDRTYTNIEGTEYAPNDKYRRLEASKTIFIRNSRG